MMLFLGFGFLMTFLRRFGYSALVQTMLVIAISVELAVLLQGLIFRGFDEESGYVLVGMTQYLITIGIFCNHFDLVALFL